jgi:uncharacterized membrane protein
MGNEAPAIIWPVGGRRIVGILSIIGVFGFGAAIVYSGHVRAGYIYYLVFTFLWFLALFHAGYAYSQRLTQRQVRKIDYWYLGAAALGMLLFALGVTNQREVVLGRGLEMIYKEEERVKRQTVVDRANAYSAIACGQEITKISRASCDHSGEFLRVIQSDAALQKLKELTISFGDTNIKNMVDLRRKRAAAKLETGGSDDPLLIASVDLKMAMEQLQGWRLRTPPPESPGKTFDENAELVLAVGQTIVWPFLLAFALALRIAKVTVDVFGWADS